MSGFILFSSASFCAEVSNFRESTCRVFSKLPDFLSLNYSEISIFLACFVFSVFFLISLSFVVIPTRRNMS